MSLFVKQFRFYGEGSEKNYPENINYENLTLGTIFSDFIPILSLGIQSLPGTKFFINNSEAPIILGPSGLYEIALNKSIPINALKFNLQSLMNISSNENSYLIIDILYEEEGV